MTKRVPEIPNAPGLTWRPRKNGWECRWQARTDLVKRGYIPKSARLFSGPMEDYADPVVVAFIQSRSTILQDEMLAWARGGIPRVPVSNYDGTLTALAGSYQSDPDSPYRKLRYQSRVHYDSLIRKIVTEHGFLKVSEIKARVVLRMHEGWTEGGKVAMAHALVGMLRTLVGFGATILEDPECERVSGVLSHMRFTMAKPRNERLTAEQATAIRAEAHRRGLHSIALAQAIQFECMLRQKDVIGEWVPMTEPGLSDVTDGNSKWLRGIRWEEIDGNLVLRHVTSKRQKAVEIPLAGAPMVVEELANIARPASGPVVVDERTGKPWQVHLFRKRWRAIADACGVPASVRNMDSRAGAISEATDAGADLEHVRHAATHSDISMTQRYSRAGAEKTANVMRIRAEHRNKKGTDR